MLIEASRSCLLLVDVQERLVPAVADADLVVRNAETLIHAANRLSVPVMASEQYRKGLGPTVAPLNALLDPGQCREKLHFGCADDPGIAAGLAAQGRDQVLIAGLETHVCVLQSAFGLQRAGYLPYVVADATASRTVSNKTLALDRLRRAGIGIVSVEMVLFEWLGIAGTPEFKELSRLIK